MPLDQRAINKGDRRGGKRAMGGHAVYGLVGSAQHSEEPAEDSGLKHNMIALWFLQAPSGCLGEKKLKGT